MCGRPPPTTRCLLGSPFSTQLQFHCLSNPTPSEHSTCSTCSSPVLEHIQPGSRVDPSRHHTWAVPGSAPPLPSPHVQRRGRRVSIKSREAAPLVPRVLSEASRRGMEGSRESPQGARGLGQFFLHREGIALFGEGPLRRPCAPPFPPSPATCPTGGGVYPSRVTLDSSAGSPGLLPNAGLQPLRY